MVWPEASVVKVLRRPGQPPDPPWLRCIQRTKLGKPFGTRRNPLVTHEWVMRHERFKIEPGIERGTGPSGIRMETASSRIRLRSFTASRRRSPRRLRAAEYSDQSAKRVLTSSVDQVESKFGCIHQDAGIDEPMTSLPQSDVHLGPRISSPITVDFMTELAVSNPSFTDSVQHTVRPVIPYRRREYDLSIMKASRRHKHR